MLLLGGGGNPKNTTFIIFSPSGESTLIPYHKPHQVPSSQLHDLTLFSPFKFTSHLSLLLSNVKISFYFPRKLLPTCSLPSLITLKVINGFCSHHIVSTNRNEDVETSGGVYYKTINPVARICKEKKQQLKLDK